MILRIRLNNQMKPNEHRVIDDISSHYETEVIDHITNDSESIWYLKVNIDESSVTKLHSQLMGKYGTFAITH